MYTQLHDPNLLEFNQTKHKQVVFWEIISHLQINAYLIQHTLFAIDHLSIIPLCAFD